MYAMMDGQDDFIVYLDGELDHFRAEALRDAVDGTLGTVSKKRVIFDMTGVTFMDSSGIGFLLGRYKKLISRGCIAAIKGPAPAVDKMLEMSGIYKIIRKEQ